MHPKILTASAAFALLALVVGIGPAGAQTPGTLFVRSDKVGVGTDNPQAPLHIRTQVGEPNIRLETADNAGVRFELKNAGGEWEFIHGPKGAFNFNRVGVAGNQFVFAQNGNLVIQGVLVQGSSRSIKRNFQPVDSREILARVANLPLSTWGYKTDSPRVRHLGPMAEDFSEIFEIGPDPSHVAPSDMAGVALAAIQGLNETLQEKDQRIEALEGELAELKALVLRMANNRN
jgi:hypothetical protein